MTNLNQHEADVVVANLQGSRLIWFHAFRRAIINGTQERADYCLGQLIFFDRIIDKVRNQAKA